MGLSPESSSAPAIAVSERVYIIKEKKPIDLSRRYIYSYFTPAV